MKSTYSSCDTKYLPYHSLVNSKYDEPNEEWNF